eukprot:6214834-Pleurochrysis_carterae.AAC.1
MKLAARLGREGQGSGSEQPDPCGARGGAASWQPPSRVTSLCAYHTHSLHGCHGSYQYVLVKHYGPNS